MPPRDFPGRMGMPRAKSIIMELFPPLAKIWERAKSPKGIIVAIVLLLLLLLSELIKHALYGWLNDLLVHKAGSIMHTVGSFIKWTGNNQITFILILGFIYCLFIILGAQLKSNKPRIREIQHMWPIILMGTGVFLFVVLFVVGAIWFNNQQSKAIAALSQPAISHPQLDKVTKLITQLDDITKKQARLHLLKRDQSKLDDLIKNYEDLAQRKYNEYLQELPISDPMRVNRINNSIIMCLNQIRAISSDDFKEGLLFNDIKGYDTNRPFKEDGQITDEPRRYEYRKAKYEYISNKGKIDKLISRFNNEIEENERFIDNYAKNIKIPPK